MDITGTTENQSGVSETGGVTSGSASDAMIAAAEAASSAEASSTQTEADGVARPTGESGDTQLLDTRAGVAKPDATGPQGEVGKGEAPKSRIEAAVKNARETAITETEAKYAWAKGVSQEAVTTAFSTVSALLKDPMAFAKTLAAEVGLKLADETPTGKGTTDGPTEYPKPDLQSEDGKGAYSAETLMQALEVHGKKIAAQIRGEMKPLLDDREKASLREQSAHITQQATNAATSLMKEAATWPYFMMEKDGKTQPNPKILGYLQAIPEATRLRNPEAAFHRAYQTFMQKDIIPFINQTSEQRVRSSNLRKAASSTGSGHPVSAGQGGEKTEITSVNALARHMEQMAANGVGG